MHIDSVELYRYSLPLLVRPSRTRDADAGREGILVRLISDGVSGWGEIAPLPGFSPETLEDARSVAITEAGSLAGLSVPVKWGMLSSDRAFVDHPSVAFGVELALSNLSARICGIPLAAWISPSGRKQVDVSGVLFGDTDTLDASVRDGLMEGRTALKLKVGRLGLEEDVHRVHVVREAMGTGPELRLDANRAWEYGEAKHFLSKIDDCNIAYIEEPLRNPMELGALAEESGARIALDESAPALFYRTDAARDPRDWSFLTALILKPTIVGGLHATFRWATIFESVGVEPVLSSAFESIIGVNGIHALAAALPGSGWAAGLDTLRFLGESVLKGPEPAIGDLAGCLDSAEVDLDRLERIF